MHAVLCKSCSCRSYTTNKKNWCVNEEECDRADWCAAGGVHTAAGARRWFHLVVGHGWLQWLVWCWSLPAADCSLTRPSTTPTAGRLRISHTQLSHSYLLAVHVVLPLLLFIYSLNVHFNVRENYFSVLSMEACFTQLKLVIYLVFLREIGFYHHI